MVTSLKKPGQVQSSNISGMSLEQKANLVTSLSSGLPKDFSFIKPGSLGPENTLLAKELVKDGDVQMRTPKGLNALTAYVHACEFEKQIQQLLEEHKGKAKWSIKDVFKFFRAIETRTPVFFYQPQDKIPEIVCNRFTRVYERINPTIIEMGGWQVAVKKYKTRQGYA